MNGFTDRIGIYDIFSRFVAGFVFLLNLVILCRPFISLEELCSFLPTDFEFLSILIIVALAYVFGIALAPLGILLGHFLFNADIENAIKQYRFRKKKKDKKKRSFWKQLKYTLKTIFKNKQNKKDLQETEQWKQLYYLLQKFFGKDLSKRAYHDLARAKLKEECPNTSADIDRLNATAIMMRSIATTEVITAYAALVILVTTKSNYLFYSLLFFCSLFLFAVLFHQSIKSQRWWVRQIFNTFFAINITSHECKTLPPNVFRANVGILIINSKGEVLAMERSDIKDAWQLPQGGIKEDESTLKAALREVQEETSIDKNNLEYIAKYPEWLAYELPSDKRSGKHGRGQVQKWYLFRFTGEDSYINLDQAIAQEFTSWKWMKMQKLIKKTAPFRQSIYKKLDQDFSQYLAK